MKISPLLTDIADGSTSLVCRFFLPARISDRLMIQGTLPKMSYVIMLNYHFKDKIKIMRLYTIIIIYAKTIVTSVIMVAVYMR